MNDWRSYGQDTDRVTHRDAMNMFYKKMIEKDILVFKSDVTHENVEPMFPTDERVEWKRKRKENKEKGIEVKKRTKVVEDHHDDCGDNLLGLGDDVSELLMYYSFENDYEPLVQGLCHHWFKGSDWTAGEFSTKATTMNSMKDMICYLNELGEGVDLVELCGGEARTSVIAIRRHLSVGENFDLVTNWNLNDPEDQKDVLMYFKLNRPLVAIMGPTCKPFGKLANYNYKYHYDTWRASYEEAAPHGRFCGEIALLQDKHRMYFVCENPKDSWLFAEHPWPEVLNRKSTVQVIVDQCTMGLRTKEGLLAKKPTVLVSNSEILLSPFKNQRCKGNHEHGLLVGGRAAAAQVWPWNFANRMVEGVVRLKEHLDNQWIQSAYPSVGSGPQDEDAPVSKSKCYGCRNNLSKHDTRHTRVEGECKRYLDEPIDYACKGCKTHKPIDHRSHSYEPNVCKWATTTRRRSTMRQGKHPRQGRTPATDDETKDMQAQNIDGEDLGNTDEIFDEVFPPLGEGGSEPSDLHRIDPEPAEPGDDPAGDPAAPGTPAVQTRAAHTRTRKKFADTGTGAERRSDWTRFDIGNVLRVLKTSENRGTLQREIRKLALKMVACW